MQTKQARQVHECKELAWESGILWSIPGSGQVADTNDATHGLPTTIHRLTQLNGYDGEASDLQQDKQAHT